jgi:hypothetical protein
VELNDSVEVVRLLSMAGYLFAADNQRTQRPFVPEIGTGLAKEFGAADFVVQPGERPNWFVRQGAIKFSDKRQITVSVIAGGAHELTATVEGSSEDARDVLLEAWSRMGELAGETECVFTDYPGSHANMTTAIVRLPVTCTTLIPPLKIMSDYAKAKLGGILLEVPGALSFRLSIPLSLAVRGMRVERHLVIEPRFTALTDDRVYYTSSPLASDEHLEMLRLVVERTAVAGGGA